MRKTLQAIGNANLIQAALIRRFADRRGIAADAAAMIWIPRFARAFRAFYTRHA